ncbi:hypothetical protein N8459_03385 [Nitrosopumilus sp.]|nr:hypothetical protein [Nitrosopumilus sp.]
MYNKIIELNTMSDVVENNASDVVDVGLGLNWHKLSKTLKCSKVDIFAKTYVDNNGLTEKDQIALSNYLKKCIVASRLQKNKDVSYNKDTGTIEEIDSLKFNSTSGKFTLVKYDNLNNSIKNHIKKNQI